MSYLLLSPLSYLLLAVLLALLARRLLPRRRGTWVLPSVLGVVSLVLMTPLGANWLVRGLEQQVLRVEAACAAQPPTTIVVLGGGFDRRPLDDADAESLTAPSLRRVIGAVQLWQRQPDAHLVMAGGGNFAVAEADAMGRLAQQLGVPADRLRLETRSTSTFENLARVADLQPPVERRIWLVSSAMHLPRAMAVAQRDGFTPCAYATDRRYIPPGGLGYYLPQTSALAKSEAALHEWVGAAVYAWRASPP